MQWESFRCYDLRTAWVAACLAVVIAAGEASAQSVRVEGVVRDPAGAAIAGAEVTLEAGIWSDIGGTDSGGRFVFDAVPETSGSLRVGAAGFATVEQAWKTETGSSLRLEIVLSAAGLEERIMVTATRMETRLSDIAGSAVVLTAEDLSATPALFVDDKLRQIPGFTLFRRSGSRTANPTSQGVSLRGLGASGASRALVLEDGIPLNDPFGGWVYWGRLPQQALGSVEVVRGGASSLYGSGALGGVIQFLSREEQGPAFSLSTAVGYGNQETANLSLTAQGRTGQWGAMLAADLIHTDGYILVAPNQRGPIDTPANSEHATLDLTLGRSFGEHSRVFGRGLFFTEARHNGTPIQTNDTRMGQAAIGADMGAGARGSISLRLYGGAQRFNQYFSAVASDRRSESLTNRQHVPAQQIGGSGLWSGSIGRFQNLVAGVETRDVRGSSHEDIFSSGTEIATQTSGGQQRTVGVFAEDVVRVAQKWTLTAGVRFDHWRNFHGESVRAPLASPGSITLTPFEDRTDTALSPRLSLLYAMCQNVSLTASAYRAFRSPTLNELYRSFRVGNVVTGANPALHAERLTGAELGANSFAFNRKLNLRGTFFWSDIVNPIANVTLNVTPTLTVRQRQNLGRTRSRGVELDTVARLTDTIQVSGGYQFTDASVARFPSNPGLEGLAIPQVPRHQLTLLTRYSNPSRFLLSVLGRFVGSQFEDDQNQLRLEPYFQLDLLVGRSLGHGVEIFAAFENLLNQRYTVGLTPVSTLGPPLLARIGLRFNYAERSDDPARQTRP
jgi:outer membrane receptor protein involved in Fe transport